jgi:large subunit ribosomal protein L33
LTLRVEPLGSSETCVGGSMPAALEVEFAMAKSSTIKVKLVSSADTGFYYVTKKNSRTQTDKLVKKKYDPVARKHVEFREAKIK